jgi:flagellar basal-body rod protein FlgB
MIDALFNQTNYVAAKKMLDATVVRHEAIAANLANLETPGYQRVDLSRSFQEELRRAIAAGNPKQIASLKPTLAPDPSALPNSRDGNTVNLEQELLELNQNALAHAFQSQLITGRLLRLKLAITGRPA